MKDKNFPLDADILLKQSLFPSQPYQQGEVKQFMKEVKFGNVDIVAWMIQRDPLLVFQYDEMD